MEVRIRSANDTTSRLLADVPFRPDVIDQIIPTLGGWGVYTHEHSLADTDALTGQFVDDGERAYFEVIVGLED